ncbi:hypothetical protein DMA12_01580 [Amycolatopsis balhimycina DSM 5908]|uniref:PLL-like beta propeller domain-containing protein n=1 Tax=Amycolatopsis balhimycina DSM 5908 TaxID=1081091 RepID=A0A428X6A6_AMYBA|nr:hypothetical protein [Amycolatopsis balhimycina]RSM50858.1 hypothetical protein DMA12_01580 [Amycolatopsis balhimycina DSM 5908]
MTCQTKKHSNSRHSRAGARTTALATIALAAGIVTAGPASADSGTYYNSGSLTPVSTGLLGTGVGNPLTGEQMVARARDWVAHQVTYNQSQSFSDAEVGGPYRTDCGGLVDMAWQLPASPVVTTPAPGIDSATYSTKLSSWSQLQPGDALAVAGEHINLFAGWTNSAHTSFTYIAEDNPSVRTGEHSADLSDPVIDGYAKSSFELLRSKNLDTAPVANTSAQLTAVGNDGHIYHEIRNPNGTWSGFQPLPGYAGAATFSAPSVAVAGMPGGSAQVVAVGNDGKVYHTIRRTDGTWTGWSPLNFTAKRVSIAAMPDGSSQVLAEAPDGTLYHNVRYTPSGSWQGFRALAGFGSAATFQAGSAAVAGMPDGSAQFIAVGNDGMTYHNIRRSNGTWQGWSPVGLAAGSVGVAGMPAGGSAQFVAVGTDGKVWHNIRRADGTWQGWSAPGFVAKEVSIAAIADGSAQVLAEAPNGTVYHDIRYTSGTWQGFRPLAGYEGGATFQGSAIGISGFPY